MFWPALTGPRGTAAAIPSHEPNPLLDYGLILEKTIGGNLKDWRAIAAAYRVDLKGPDLDRAIQALPADYAYPIHARPARN